MSKNQRHIEKLIKARKDGVIWVRKTGQIMFKSDVKKHTKMELPKKINEQQDDNTGYVPRDPLIPERIINAEISDFVLDVPYKPADKAQNAELPEPEMFKSRYPAIDKVSRVKQIGERKHRAEPPRESPKHEYPPVASNEPKKFERPKAEYSNRQHEDLINEILNRNV